MKFTNTKKTLTWCGAWVLMGATFRSSHMAAGGVVALIVWIPAALVIDLWRSRKPPVSVRPGPQLRLFPPE